MDTRQRILEDVQKHLSSLQKRRSDALRETERAEANSTRRSLEISSEADSSLANIAGNAKKKYAAIHQEYKAKRAVLDRAYEQKKMTLDAATKRQRDEIKRTAAEQMASLTNDDSIGRRKAARELQEKLARNEWSLLRERITAVGISASNIAADASFFLQTPEALIKLKEDLERIDSMPKGRSATGTS